MESHNFIQGNCLKSPNFSNYQQLSAVKRDVACRQQIPFCRVRFQRLVAVEQTGKHITHHVLALGFVVEDSHRQAVHLCVVCLEQIFDLIPCHTSTIQVRRGKCKALSPLFSSNTSFFCQRSYKKAHKETLGKPKNRMPRVKL